MLHRRNFLQGMIAAPAVIRSSGLLMPIKSICIEPITIFEKSVDWRAYGAMLAAEAGKLKALGIPARFLIKSRLYEF